MITIRNIGDLENEKRHQSAERDEIGSYFRLLKERFFNLDVSQPEIIPHFVRLNLNRGDFCGAKLSGASLENSMLIGADLRGADLSKTDLSFAFLYQAQLTYADLSVANLTCASLQGANLIGANLSGANLEGTDLSHANLTDADLTGIKVNRLTVFYGAKMSASQIDLIIGDKLELYTHFLRSIRNIDE